MTTSRTGRHVRGPSRSRSPAWPVRFAAKGYWTPQSSSTTP